MNSVLLKRGTRPSGLSLLFYIPLLMFVRCFRMVSEGEMEYVRNRMLILSSIEKR